MASGWIKLCEIPIPSSRYYIGRPTFKRINKVILPIGDSPASLISLLEYDTIKDECTEIIKLQKSQNYKPDSAIINLKNNTLYLAGRNGLCKLDLTTQNQVENITKSVKFDGTTSTAIIGDTLHIFSQGYGDEAGDVTHSEFDIILRL